ncbi:phosducin-like protein 3 [Lingula anatina]|uniref:Phosducin-like protein 3 n=1 Tax=Lingula anatina TaxID=7574 RepID=A0A1S3IB86_LINAN|nr:phosducin-like protein 3 [Lingula anatina]|eukprot:XP_013395433.1 phosducin-like protein 3 [Lingula anatina]
MLIGKPMDKMTLDELDDIEDEIDEEEERIFEQYRKQRMAEMRAAQMKAKFGEVREITKADYVDEVNKAGDGVWVVLHIYKDSIPLCKLLNQHLSLLARKNPQVKFLKSISSLCIPNYPDKNLPTIFLYFEGDLKKQWVGPLNFGGMNFKCDELEWMLAKAGVLETELETPPKPEVKDVMNIAIKQSTINDTNSDDDNDWN